MTTSHDLKPPTPAPSPLTLPPIFLAKSSSLVTAGQDSAENRAQEEEHQNSGSTTSSSLGVKKSETAPTVMVVDPAAANSTSVSSGIHNSTASSRRGSLSILSKVSSFTNPRILVSCCSTNKSKYIVLPLSSRDVGDTLMDLEGGETMAAGLASKPSPPVCTSQSQPQLGAAAKLVGLNASRIKSKPVLSEALRRRLRDSRTVVTVEELETQSPANLNTNRTGRNLVPTGNRKQVNVPVARRIGGGGGGVRTRRDAPKKKPAVHPPPKKILLRQELPLAKGLLVDHKEDIIIYMC